MVSTTAIDRFRKLREARDGLSKQVATLQGKLESSKERYNHIMRELAEYGIGSVDELSRKIEELNSTINVELDSAETALRKLEAELNENEIDHKETGTTISR